MCRECVLAAHKTLGFPLFFVFGWGRRCEGNRAGESKIRLKDFVFLRGGGMRGGIFDLSFCFRSVSSRRRARFFCWNGKGFASVLGEMGVWQGRFFWWLAAKWGGAFIFFAKKIRIFSCVDRWIGFFFFS